jgi:hypothetical protein
MGKREVGRWARRGKRERGRGRERVTEGQGEGEKAEEREGKRIIYLNVGKTYKNSSFTLYWSMLICDLGINTIIQQCS